MKTTRRTKFNLQKSKEILRDKINNLKGRISNSSKLCNRIKSKKMREKTYINFRARRKPMKGTTKMKKTMKLKLLIKAKRRRIRRIRTRKREKCDQMSFINNLYTYSFYFNSNLSELSSS